MEYNKLLHKRLIDFKKNVLNEDTQVEAGRIWSDLVFALDVKDSVRVLEAWSFWSDNKNSQSLSAFDHLLTEIINKYK